MIKFVSGAILLVALLSCTGSPAPVVTPGLPAAAPIRGAPPTIEQTRIGLTHHRSDGNRLVSGTGSMSTISPIDIPLKGKPLWLVGVSEGAEVIWAVVLEDGLVQGFRVSKGRYTLTTISPDSLPPGMPPVLTAIDSQPRLLTALDTRASFLSAPGILQPSERIAYILRNGEVVIEDGDSKMIDQLDALLDARLLTSQEETMLFLTGPSSSYDHGVLGDNFEASGAVLVDAKSLPWEERELELSGTDVIEGIAPIWADLDGDGEKEIVVTLSNRSEGARIAVYNENGQLKASGPPIGMGFRWRHQLAVAPFGPRGETELAVVGTPHIGGVVEFYQLTEDGLEIAASLPGYSSHRLGSRNLDLALAGDFDGEGSTELLLPDQRMENLAGIRRTPDGAEEAWTVPIGGSPGTNLAAVTNSRGDISVGIGREDRVLRIWSSS